MDKEMDIDNSLDLTKFSSEEKLNMLRSLFADEKNFLANSANFAAFIYHSLPNLNWSGFYLLSGAELILGSFIGKTACVRIDLERGVCGKAAREKAIVIVDDVHSFPGHIACDVASASEMVLPILKEDILFGVFDLDSPINARFDSETADYLTKALDIFIEQTDFTMLEKIYRQ